jgi:hypothetical protein
VTQQRDVYSTGEMAGKLFAECLLNYADGSQPLTYPCGGAARDHGTDKFSLVQFPEGMGDATQRWLSSPDRRDAVLMQFPDPAARSDSGPLPLGREIRFLLASCNGTSQLDLVCAFNVTFEGGKARTSLPGYRLFGASQDIYDRFIEGLGDGMSSHRRAEELDEGFGELGAYRQP